MQDQRDHCDEYDDYDDVLDKLQPEYHKDYQHDYRCKAFKQRHGNTKKPKSCICIKITRGGMIPLNIIFHYMLVVTTMARRDLVHFREGRVF